jgi:N-acetylmuramoyl-L-alanine amidase
MARICIDPGHCKEQNRSPGIPEYYESEMVWKLANMKKNYLMEMGHTVIMTRTDPNKDVALVTRGKMSKGCDLFDSDHSNAVGSFMNEKRNEIAVYHLVEDRTTECDDESKRFAEGIAPVISKIMELPYGIHTRAAQSDRNGDGFKNDNYYGVLHGCALVKTPGVILEHGFHTHSATVRWLLEDANLDRLARAEAEFMDKYFGKTESGVYVPTPAEQNESQAGKAAVPFRVKVSIDDLNIRTGPGTGYAKTGKYTGKGMFTIVQVSGSWGYLKSKAGWICLNYVTRI